jgi:glycosyltransferase involved in cell wall biosynthesis
MDRVQGRRRVVTEPPTFSVVIPTWNRAELVGGAIQSVLAQTFADFEVIVVDDGSTDRTCAVRGCVADHRVRVLCRPHQGVGASRNAGVEAAIGKYVAFLDSDDTVSPTWLDAFAARLEDRDADVAVAGYVKVHPDGRQTTWVPDSANRSGEALVPRVQAGCIAIRRTLLLDAGGYDPALTYGENTELSMRLFSRRRAPLIEIVPEPLVRIRAEPRLPTADGRSARAADARRVLDRHRPGRDVPELRSSYHAMVGVDDARRHQSWSARRHFLGAVVLQPSRREHWSRLAVSLVPGGSRRAWGVGRDFRSSCRPSVMFVVLAPGVGGSVRSLATVLSGLSGVERIVARPAGTSTAAFLHERRLVDVAVDLAPSKGGRGVDRLRGVVAVTATALRHRKDLAAIHANGLSDLNFALLPAVLLGCPVVVWVHEWQVSPWTRRIRWLLRVVPITVAAVSHQGAETVLASGIAAPSRVVVVPNPIDPDDVRAGSRLTQEFTAAYVGTPARYKGFHLMPDIVAATEGHPVRWVVFSGPRSMMEETFRQLDALGVEVRGKVRDVREVYGFCDAVVVPSERESFGRVVVEAMANGIPVVASDIEPLAELLGGGEAGLLVPCGDAGAFAEAVVDLGRRPDLRSALGAAGQRRSAAFSPAPIVAQLRTLYGLPDADAEGPRREVKAS